MIKDKLVITLEGLEKALSAILHPLLTIPTVVQSRMQRESTFGRSFFS